MHARVMKSIEQQYHKIKIQAPKPLTCSGTNIHLLSQQPPPRVESCVLMPVKGLEPEIERIMEKHKADMEDIERGHHVSTGTMRGGDGSAQN